MRWIAFAVLFLVARPAFAEPTLAEHLQSVSVTVTAEFAQGSGVIISRELKLKKDKKETAKVNFVWTAAHVVDALRSTRKIIDPKTGAERKVIEFKPAWIVQELSEDGRKVGELRMECKVIRYSDPDNGEDLAILVVRKRGFIDDSAKFYSEAKIVPIGTEVIHVGSMHGQVGANSMTKGIISQVGRVLRLGEGDGTVFDQTTATAFRGSSGGGIFFATGDRAGHLVGILTRGVSSGDNFNYMVPVRRIRDWAERTGVLWAMDESVPVPSLEEILAVPVEDAGVPFGSDEDRNENNKRNGTYFLLKKP